MIYYQCRCCECGALLDRCSDVTEPFYTEIEKNGAYIYTMMRPHKCGCIFMEITKVIE